MTYDIYNKVTFNQIHNNFNQTKFYIEKVTIIIKEIDTEAFSQSHRCLIYSFFRKGFFIWCNLEIEISLKLLTVLAKLTLVVSSCTFLPSNSII